MKFKKVLVVIAHPDDEVLGVGGFICALRAAGTEVKILYLNAGNTFREDFDQEVLFSQITSVVRKLDATSWVSIPSFPTSRFPEHSLDITKKVSEVVASYQPDTVITHDVNDLHQDHLIVNKSVMVACRYKHGSCVKNVLTFPVISSSDIHPDWKWYANYYVDIAPYIDKKIEAMQLYETEYKELVHHRGENAIRTWAAFYGLHANMKYAEPFKIIRSTYE